MPTGAHEGAMCAYGNPNTPRIGFPYSFQSHFQFIEFTLTSRTLYHQQFYAVEANIVPNDRLFPLTISPMQCTFVRDKQCAISKRFHNYCLIPSERHWSSTYATLCESQEEAIETLCAEKDNWWCDFCHRPLFKKRNCLFF